MKKTKKLLCLLLVVGLVFTSGIFSFADEPEPIESTSVELDLSLFEAAEVSPLTIKSVEVLIGGATQILYRQEVYRGVAANDEDPAKFYTTRREINLKDPRVFNVEFTVPAASLGIFSPEVFLSAVSFEYGGFPLSAWGNGNDWRGSTAIMILTGREIIPAGDDYIVKASIRVNSPWTTTNSTANNNVPYNSYNAGTQNNFGSGQNNDNRAFFLAGPTRKGPGTYALTAVVGGQPIAAADIHIGPYDQYRSWTDINEFSQDLIEAITGDRISIAALDLKPTGLMAAGYVSKTGDDYRAGYVKGTEADSVYVEVHILGYGFMDNYASANLAYNNYSRFNPTWNIVVAKDGKTVDDYLKPGGIKAQMDENPRAMFDKYKDMAPEDFDFVLPYYQNNVHPDEVTGTDSMIHLIDQLIEGGKAGKDIKYKTFDRADLNWNYRPENVRNTSEATYNHVVDSSKFSSAVSRQDEVLNTKDILDCIIMVSTLCSNPDGKANMKRTNAYGFDVNRDAIFASQPESINITRDVAKWDPIVVIEWHGYYTQMMIEPPGGAYHNQFFEPDLKTNNMIELAYTAGKALTASTGYNRFYVPWDSISDGWEDDGTIYAPFFGQLFGGMGWTVELPHSNSDSFEAGNAINYGMLKALIEGNTAHYEENSLNRSIDGKDSHSVDNKYTSLKKSVFMNMIEFKLRAKENIDSPAADKYFIEVINGRAGYIGRERKDDGAGGKLSFFPDYFVIPADPDTQWNTAEAIKTINIAREYGSIVSRTTELVTYDGVTYPIGTYVFDMRQSRRNYLAAILHDGYDLTRVPQVYADVYTNFPFVRGFDCHSVWSPGLFDGKMVTVDNDVEKKANIQGAPDDFVVFKSNSTDAVRFVNLLLSGKSSGPSFAEKGDVWMLRKNVSGVGNMSDYIIKTSDLPKISNLADNPDFGLNGCYIEGKYIGFLPDEAVPLVEPVITLNTTRNVGLTGGPIWWALEGYLGFNMDGYNGGANLRSNSNVIVSYNATPGAALINAVRNDKAGLVLIQSAAVLTNANFGTGGTAPTTGTFNDLAVYGTYNVDDSLFTANYENTDSHYARGTYFTGNLPVGSKILFRSASSDAFIAGFQNTSGAKTTFQNRTTMFSSILSGGGITGKPVQSVTFGSNMFYRPHYYKFHPVLATAIFAGAAGILDDQNDPVFTGVTMDSGTVTFNAVEPASGVAESGVDPGALELFKWEGFSYVFVSDDLKASAAGLKSGDVFRASATDYAGNKATAWFTYDAATSVFVQTDYDPITPPPTVYASISALPSAHFQNAVEYTLKIKEAVNVLAIDFEFVVDGTMLTGSSFETLNGFSAIEAIDWSDNGDGTWTGAVRFGYTPPDGEDGFTSAPYADVAKIIFDSTGVLGAANLTITKLDIVGYDDAVEEVVFFNVIIEEGVGVTVLFNKYDLNKDGFVDLVDLGIMLMYVGYNEDDPEWDALVKVKDKKGNPITAKDCDVNGDGEIDIADLVELIANFGLDV